MVIFYINLIHFEATLFEVLRKFRWKNSIQQETDSFHQQIELKYNEQSSKVLHLDHFNGAENWTL